MKIELTNCTNQLLWEISLKEITRDRVAFTYALAIVSSEKTEWGRVNRAIITRWSLNALKYIKRKAWRLVEEWRK